MFRMFLFEVPLVAKPHLLFNRRSLNDHPTNEAAQALSTMTTSHARVGRFGSTLTEGIHFPYCISMCIYIYIFMYIVCKYSVYVYIYIYYVYI